MSEFTATTVLPQQSVRLETTARGQIMIEVKVNDADGEIAANKAQAIFDRLRAHYKEVNDENSEYYRGK